MDSRVIEIVTSEYIDKLYELEQEVFSEDIYSKDILLSNINNDSYINLLCKDKNNNVLGYITMSQVLDEAELLKIAVASSNQRSGIGKMLLNFAEDILKNNNIKYIYLEVRKDNNSAIKFYENNGFEKISIREKYYNGVDAYIYRKGL